MLQALVCIDRARIAIGTSPKSCTKCLRHRERRISAIAADLVFGLLYLSRMVMRFMRNAWESADALFENMQFVNCMLLEGPVNSSRVTRKVDRHSKQHQGIFLTCGSLYDGKFNRAAGYSVVQ